MASLDLRRGIVDRHRPDRVAGHGAASMLYSLALEMEALMVDEADPAEYDIRRDEAGWTVFDVATDAPASLNGLPQTGLRMDAAIRMADLLTTLEEGDAD